jgi:hypothetical protein
MTQADRVYITPPLNTPVDTTRRRFLAVAAFASVAGAGSLAVAAMAPNDVPLAVTVPRHCGRSTSVKMQRKKLKKLKKAVTAQHKSGDLDRTTPAASVGTFGGRFTLRLKRLLSRSDRTASDENSQRDCHGAAHLRGNSVDDIRTTERKSSPRRIRNGLLSGRPGNCCDTASHDFDTGPIF